MRLFVSKSVTVFQSTLSLRTSFTETWLYIIKKLYIKKIKLYNVKMGNIRNVSDNLCKGASFETDLHVIKQITRERKET